MFCEECATNDNVFVHIHPQTSKRYCYKCWRSIRPNAPIPIDCCSNAVKNTAAMTGGVVWKPKDSTMAEPNEKSVITQIFGGMPIKCCGVCNMVLAHCICPSSTSQVKRKVELNKCCLCKNVSNDGIWVDTDLYWCGSCLAEVEEGGGMTSKHIKLKLKGPQKAIEFFHYVCTQIDNDWPWSEKVTFKPCEKCGGMLYINAVLDPEDIREIGQHAGLKKCKIVYFGDVGKCLNRG